MLRYYFISLFLLSTLHAYGKEVFISPDHLVKLLDVNLTHEKTAKMFDAFSEFSVERDYSKGISFLEHDLGMGFVPVLDQGQHGTCVTFAATAALDALISAGDAIDQQCSLGLNKSLGNDLWNGAYYPSEVIDPLKKYGVVGKNKCNAFYPSPSVLISVNSYKKKADKSLSASVSKVGYTYYPSADLGSLKSAVLRGNRVLIAFVVKEVSEAVLGFNVVKDGVSYSGGLWACAQGGENYCGLSNAGHEVVVVGFDDSQELLKIRNSWGDSVGELGDYYMSYKFFESQVIDMTEVY